MLEKLDLSKKVSKEDYNRIMEELGERLGAAPGARCEEACAHRVRGLAWSTPQRLD